MSEATMPAQPPAPAAEIRQAFRDLTLRLGGIAAIHCLEDEAVWALARAVDHAYQKSLHSVAPPALPEGQDTEVRKHPAITHLLSKIEIN